MVRRTHIWEAVRQGSGKASPDAARRKDHEQETLAVTEMLTRRASLADIVEHVGRERAQLVDHWEAAALIESFGYTDTRVRDEFGFPDTITLGAYVFEVLLQCPRAAPPLVVEPEPGRLITLVGAVSVSLVYAAPWLATFVAERVDPDALRLPGDAGPPLSIGLMFSLIVSGGFIQAISRRGQFYIGLKQPGLAAQVCGYLFRIGAAAAVVAAVAGILVGWYFSLFSWPYLILAADQFIVLSLLWMTCGILTIRREHWRVPLAFAAGAAVFVLLRASGLDALVSQLAATATVLAAALLQVRYVFSTVPVLAVPLPRVTVLLYRLLPYFWCGTVYFCFLFADRLTASASVAALSGAPFGMRQDYKLGMDVALLTFLFGSAIVEYANVRFTLLMTRQIRTASTEVSALAASVRRLHVRVLAMLVAGYVPVAVLVGACARAWLPGEPPSVWTTLLVGDVGYMLFAVGLLNVLVLFSLNDPWAAVRGLTAALVVNVAVGAVMSHTLTTYFAAGGLIAGGIFFAVFSTIAVRECCRRVDYAVASF
jgi:hypothetical protein